MAYESPIFGNADGCQAKASGSDAGAETRVIDPNIASILNQSRLRIRLLPEEEEVSAFQLVKKLIVGGGDGTWKGWGRRVRILLLGMMLGPVLARRAHCKKVLNRQAERNAHHLAQQSPARV
jgi:hypothetical protein